MKPNFALNLTDTSIALLHRTAKGWLKVGETDFDTADLDGAMLALRKRAQGLDSDGIAARLIIPNSQILYLRLPSSARTPEEIRAAILAELVERTPYSAEEVAFDWVEAADALLIAAVARETLTEAEDFASEHGFNPQDFVALPETGEYQGTPWFGQTSTATSDITRDVAPITLIDAPESAPLATRAIEPEVEAAAEPPAPLEAEVAPEVVAEATVEPEAEIKTEILEEPPLEAALTPEPEAEVAVEVAAEPAALDVPPPVLPEISAPASSQAPPKVSFEFASPAPLNAKASEIEAPLEAAPQEILLPEPPRQDVPDFAPRPIAPPPIAPAPQRVVQAPVPPAVPQIKVEEAPFAEIADDLADVAQGHKAQPPMGTAAQPLMMEDDDLPPAPPSGGVRASLVQRQGAQAAAQAAPQAHGLAKPLGSLKAPSLAGATRPEAALKAAKPGAAKKAKAPAPKMTAPSEVSRSAQVPGLSAEEAARSLSRSPFGPRAVQKGKPKHLGLILTAILLLCLALVAAWSSLYLASAARQDNTAVAAIEASEIDPEALADGMIPETGDGTAGASAPDPAPDSAQGAPEGLAALDPESDSAPAPTADEAITLSAADVPPPALDARSLPAPAAVSEAPPDAPMPPPAYGTVYAYDAQGFIEPMAAGIPSPDGYMIFAGKPPRLPPARSAAAEKSAAEAKEAAVLPTAAPVADPALAPAATPETAPQGAIPSTEGAMALVETPALQPNPELANQRAKARPAGIVPEAAQSAPTDAATDDGAALSPEADIAGESATASLRPKSRPEVVLASAARARAETASASLADQAVTLASAAAPALSAEDAANPGLLNISRRPASRPKDLSRAVDAALAAAIAAPAAAAAAPVAAAAPQKAARAPEPEEEDEPEVVAKAPSIPTKAGVAKSATIKGAINLSRINLIGVYGSQSNRYALIRQANGKYKKVKVGDKVDGGRIQAITQNEVRYQKGGKLVSLAMPKG